MILHRVQDWSGVPDRSGGGEAVREGGVEDRLDKLRWNGERRVEDWTRAPEDGGVELYSVTRACVVLCCRSHPGRDSLEKV